VVDTWPIWTKNEQFKQKNIVTLVFNKVAVFSAKKFAKIAENLEK
jgi:hypothetical protein